MRAAVQAAAQQGSQLYYEVPLPEPAVNSQLLLLGIFGLGCPLLYG